MRVCICVCVCIIQGPSIAVFWRRSDGVFMLYLCVCTCVCVYTCMQDQATAIDSNATDVWKAGSLTNTIEGYLLNIWHSGHPTYDALMLQRLPAPTDWLLATKNQSESCVCVCMCVYRCVCVCVCMCVCVRAVCVCLTSDGCVVHGQAHLQCVK